MSKKATLERLVAIGEDPAKLDGILITHEHSDHVAGLPRIARHIRKPVFLTHLAAGAIEWEGDRSSSASGPRGMRLSIELL